MKAKAARRERWWLYVLECRNGVLYTGIAKDVEARFAAHCNGKGAAFTRSNPPVRILSKAALNTKGAALRAEHAYKQLARPAKLRWCDIGMESFVLSMPKAARRPRKRG